MNQAQTDETYMAFAIRMSQNSKAERAKVGAVLVTTDEVILAGYNGTPRGADNVAEMYSDGELITKPDVLHAELNCIMKAARQGVSCKDATVYVTLSPCVHCAAMLVQIGIKRLVYMRKYRDTSGIDYLKNHNIIVEEYYY